MTRIVLDETKFRELVAGRIVRIGDVEMSLADRLAEPAERMVGAPPMPMFMPLQGLDLPFKPKPWT
jgi:hypothetical protein